MDSKHDDSSEYNHISKSPDLTLIVEPQDNKLKGIIQLKEVKARIIFKITFEMSFYFHMLPPIRSSSVFNFLHYMQEHVTGTAMFSEDGFNTSVQNSLKIVFPEATLLLLISFHVIPK